MNRQGMIMYKFLDGSRFLFKYCKICFSYLHRKTFISRVRKWSRRDLRDHWVQFPELPTRKGCQAAGPEFTARLELMCYFQVCRLWTCTRMFKRPHPAGSAENDGGCLMPFPPNLYIVWTAAEMNLVITFFPFIFPMSGQPQCLRWLHSS